MNIKSSTTLITAFIVTVVLFLFFSGGAMTGGMMNDGMIGDGGMGEPSWMWIPALFTLGLGVVFGWTILNKEG